VGISKTETIKTEPVRIPSGKQKQSEYRSIRRMVREIGGDDSGEEEEDSDGDNDTITAHKKKGVETSHKKEVVSSANPSASDNSASDNTSDSGINAEDDGSEDELINMIKQVSNHKVKKKS
jgi:hypothetical protein